MKMNYALICNTLLIGVVFISGCTQTGQITSPSMTGQERTTQQQIQLQTPECVPGWQCGTWSECSKSGTQTRTCIDQNNCGAAISKPTESQSCTRQIIEPSGQETTLNKSTAFIYRVIDGESIELSLRWIFIKFSSPTSTSPNCSAILDFSEKGT
jgi:hypothetical protein